MARTRTRQRKHYTIIQREAAFKPEVVLVKHGDKRYTGAAAQLADELRRQVEELTPAEREELRHEIAKRANPKHGSRAIEFEKADGSTQLVSNGAVSRLSLEPRDAGKGTEPGTVAKSRPRRDYLDAAVGDGRGSGAGVQRIN